MRETGEIQSFIDSIKKMIEAMNDGEAKNKLLGNIMKIERNVRDITTVDPDHLETDLIKNKMKI